MSVLIVMIVPVGVDTRIPHQTYFNINLTKVRYFNMLLILVMYVYVSEICSYVGPPWYFCIFAVDFVLSVWCGMFHSCFLENG